MPILVPLLCMSASLYGWDLALMALRLKSHPRETSFKLSRKYAVRCLSLAGPGPEPLSWHVPFMSGYRSSLPSAFRALCLVLFLMIHRRTHKLMEEKPAEVAKEKRTAEPSA